MAVLVCLVEVRRGAAGRLWEAWCDLARWVEARRSRYGGHGSGGRGKVRRGLAVVARQGGFRSGMVRHGKAVYNW